MISTPQSNVLLVLLLMGHFWLAFAYLSLDWEGPYGDYENDLDMYVIDEDLLLYEYSWSETRFEGDFFNGNWFPDGVYGVYIDIWTGDTPINYRFAATPFLHNNCCRRGYRGVRSDC